jgi:serine/threonine-protein kinase
LSARIGDYEVLHEIKAGGMGAVLLACRRGPGAFAQVVAIKTIRAELADSPQVRAMFLDEAATLARLNHPAVAHVHAFGDEGGELYMVMEYVAGVPFRELAELAAPPAVIARALAAAARGLHAAHEARDLAGTPLGLVHRDVSPDNLLLAYDGHAKVIDFGIALVRNRQAAVTELGTLKGKPPYMSPEQVKNQPIDRRSDVFSLGVVAWELLTRGRLFDGDSLYAVARAVEEQVIPPPSTRGAASSSALDAAVLRALERDPARRAATARDLADELERAVAGEGESLEAWATRALAAPRDAHARWLAALLAGPALSSTPSRTPPAAPAGRATGELTAVARVPHAEVEAEAEAEAEAGAASGAAARRRGAVAALSILVVVGLAGGGLYVANRHGADASTSTRGEPAAELAGEILDAGGARDASVRVAEVVVDAPSARDTGVVKVPVATHPRRTPRAGSAAGKTVASQPAQPAGTGFVTVRYKPGPYANISIDGGGSLPGPIFKRKIAAGAHVVTFLDPVTGDVLDQQDVLVVDGQTANVAQR